MAKSKRLFFRCVLYAALALLFVGMICFIGTGTASVAHAEELHQDGTEIVQEEQEEKAEPAAPVEPVDDPTFFGRVLEWVTANEAEILTVLGDIVLIACMIAQRVKQKKKLVELGTNIVTVKDDVANTASSQKSVVSVTNELIDGYNKFEKALNNFDATENERYKTLLAAFAQTKAILEILTTVYANSKNIPQGVKDLVNLKYADVLKLVGDEDKLKEIAEPAESAEEVAEVGENKEG